MTVSAAHTVGKGLMVTSARAGRTMTFADGFAVYRALVMFVFIDFVLLTGMALASWCACLRGRRPCTIGLGS